MARKYQGEWDESMTPDRTRYSNGDRDEAAKRATALYMRHNKEQISFLNNVRNLPEKDQTLIKSLIALKTTFPDLSNQAIFEILSTILKDKDGK